MTMCSDRSVISGVKVEIVRTSSAASRWRVRVVRPTPGLRQPRRRVKVEGPGGPPHAGVASTSQRSAPYEYSAALSHNNSGGSSRVDRAQHRRARRDSHEAQISRHRVRASRTSGQPGVRASRWSEGPFMGPSCGRSSWERPESRGEAQQCGITGQLQDTQELRVRVRTRGAQGLGFLL